MYSDFLPEITRQSPCTMATRDTLYNYLNFYCTRTYTNLIMMSPEESENDEACKMLGVVVLRMASTTSEPEAFDMCEFQNQFLKMYGQHQLRPVVTELALRLRERRITEVEAEDITMWMYTTTPIHAYMSSEQRDEMFDRILMVKKAANSGIRIDHVEIKDKHPPKLTVSWESEDVIRLDSLDAPEFYALIDRNRGGVTGRFSNTWFDNGDNVTPKVYIRESTIRLESPGKEFVCSISIAPKVDP